MGKAIVRNGTKKRIFRCTALIVFVMLAFPIFSHAIGFVAEDVYESVVVIYSTSGIGSGFAIGKNCIITNAHVVGDAAQVRVKSFDKENHTGNILYADASVDLAVVQVEDGAFPYLKTEDENDTPTGSDVYAIGAPNSMSYTMTKGILSAKDRKVGGYSYLQTDASINAGNSGGPLLNDSGAVIGVNTLKVTGQEGIGLSIPITSVNEFLREKGIEPDENGNVTTWLDTPKTAGAESGGTGESQNPDASLFDDFDTLQHENFTLKVLLIISVILIFILTALVIVFASRAGRRQQQGIAAQYPPSISGQMQYTGSAQYPGQMQYQGSAQQTGFANDPSLRTNFEIEILEPEHEAEPEHTTK